MTVQTTTGAMLSRDALSLDGVEHVRLAASLFYFRIPRELWAARLRQVRESGYDLVDVYLPWNFHELAPGRWDFDGRRDVGEFLDLAHAEGLGVIARPGPYICSEWDGGGLPAWLTQDPGLRLRQAEPRYLAAVERWFDRALPVLAARQYGAGGAVVAVQLENELDFFDCEDRHGYLSALRDLALAHGIHVPLVACAGQGDLVAATGAVDGVVPAFNFYPDDRSPAVEAEVRHYADLLAARELPLLVTETNRSHLTLRRLVVSGAAVVAPYLQASGYDFGYTPSVGNWGTPGGFMTHDYDFGGYLSPVGEARPEMARARVLAAVLRTLGPALARAVPEAAEDAVATTAPTSDSPSRLRLDGGGTLLGVVNLGDEASTAVLAPNGSLPAVEVELPASSCLLVSQDVPLPALGATLALCTADVVGTGADRLELAADGRSVVAIEHDGTLARLDLTAPAPGRPVLATADLDGRVLEVVVHHPHDVEAPGPEAAPAARSHEVRSLRALDLPAAEGEPTSHDRLPSSEAIGIHRGRIHCSARLDGAGDLLLEGAGDVVDLSLDGRVLPTLAGFGATTVVPAVGAGRLDAVVETWGHPNFDDARLPGLAMGSTRGLGHVWSVVERIDVGAGWTVSGPDQWAGTPAPLRTLGGWSSTRLGADVTYRRRLPVDDASHHAMHLSGLGVAARVVVDGVAHVVGPDDPWVHLDPRAGSDVAVTVPHLPGSLGGAELYRLHEVRGWQVLGQDDEAIGALAARPVDGVDVPFPVVAAPGEERWYDVDLPPGGWSLRFGGRQVRVSAFAGSELIGRVWLADDARPSFTGGDPERVWLPAAWNCGTVRLAVRFTAGAEAPVLEDVLVEAARE